MILPDVQCHDDMLKWKHFPCYCLFVWGSPHKGLWRGALMFSLVCVWTKRWVNNWDASDLRRHCAHYDVTIMAPWPINHKTNHDRHFIQQLIQGYISKGSLQIKVDSIDTIQAIKFLICLHQNAQRKHKVLLVQPNQDEINVLVDVDIRGPLSTKRQAGNSNKARTGPHWCRVHSPRYHSRPNTQSSIRLNSGTVSIRPQRHRTSGTPHCTPKTLDPHPAGPPFTNMVWLKSQHG